MQKIDPINAASEIREQLSSEKRRLCFFFGAGTSMAVGLPDITTITNQLADELTGKFKDQFRVIRDRCPSPKSVEDVLNRVRTIRELMGSSEELEFEGVKGATAARDLDVAICTKISEKVRKKSSDDLKTHTTFSQWVRALMTDREHPVEIFTTNYDVLLEEAFERVAVPYFDGFVGTISPFFLLESVDAGSGKADIGAAPPRLWTRLWKVHGSINWHVVNATAPAAQRITRLSDLVAKAGSELAVFPSRDKYSQSRKLPFLALQDRFRRTLSSGECLMVVIGYSFIDQHLNEIIFQALRSNPRLAVLCLAFGEWDEATKKTILPNHLIELSKQYRNLSIYGPDKACIGGLTFEWNDPSRQPEKGGEWSFWDDSKKKFNLGDFNKFCHFLETYIGFGASASQISAEPNPPKKA